MQTTTFAKGQSVTGKGRHAGYRYVVLTNHKDGSVTVRALFALDDAGNDLPGFLGFKYRVSPSSLAPRPTTQAA